MRVRLLAVLGMGLAVGCADASDEAASSAWSVIAPNPKPQIDQTRLTTSLVVSEVAVFQNLKVTVAREGESVAPTMPLLAGRDALVRVYVKPTGSPTQQQTGPTRLEDDGRAAPLEGEATDDPNLQSTEPPATGKTPGTKLPPPPKAAPITAVLQIADAAGRSFEVLSETKPLDGESTDAALDSTFNFKVPGSALVSGATFSVALTEPSAAPVPEGVTSSARFPADGGSAPIGISRAAEELKIMLVPVAYTNAEGATFLPDTTPEQIERYKKQFLALYPLANIEIQVHEPYPWTTGFSFGRILQAMVALRAQENPAPNVYYYGSLAPKATFAEYCASGCVTGLSGLPGPDSVARRASVGVGFTGYSSARTFAHEVGHAHGRRHAPCGGAAGPDPSFPHPGASTGRWAFNPISGALMDPAASKDMMSYCRPHFISDYNYGKLLDRLTHVNTAAAAAMATDVPKKKVAYRLVDVAEDGTMTIGQRIELTEDPGGEPRKVLLEDASGRTVGETTARMVEYDHLPGGFLFVPEQSVAFQRLHVEGIGRTR